MIPHGLYRVNADGEIEESVPFPPELLAVERRFGAEGTARVGDALVVAMQREWGDDQAGLVKLVTYDSADGTWGAVHYPLDAREAEEGWVGLSEITAHGDHVYIVERDNQIGAAARIKRLYRVPLDQLEPATLGGALPVVQKELVRDFLPDLTASGGYAVDKVEGFAIDVDGQGYAVTDNDGVDDSNGETLFFRRGQLLIRQAVADGAVARPDHRGRLAGMPMARGIEPRTNDDRRPARPAKVARGDRGLARPRSRRPSGALVAVLGPSGCGKTTLLRCLAGLEAIEAGQIALGGRAVAAPGLHVPPEDRGLAMVFQSYALWPHMSVEGNVAYPLRVSRAAGADRRTAAALRAVGLTPLAERRPAELSGGQQQRTALARALVAEPGLILMDEPLANLDMHLREGMRAEFRRLHAATGATMVLVTHDQADALSLADLVVVMEAGRILQAAAADGGLRPARQPRGRAPDRPVVDRHGRGRPMARPRAAGGRSP